VRTCDTIGFSVLNKALRVVSGERAARSLSPRSDQALPAGHRNRACLLREIAGGRLRPGALLRAGSPSRPGRGARDLKNLLGEAFRTVSGIASTPYLRLIPGRFDEAPAMVVFIKCRPGGARKRFRRLDPSRNGARRHDSTPRHGKKSISPGRGSARPAGADRHSRPRRKKGGEGSGPGTDSGMACQSSAHGGANNCGCPRACWVWRSRKHFVHSAPSRSWDVGHQTA